MFLIYFFIFLILIYLLYIIYFKIKYNFWSIQPVFHIHNLKYWLYPKGIIEKEGLKINKYYNMKNVIFKNWNNITELENSRFINFIRKNYLRMKDIVEFIPTKEKTNSYFTSHNNPCYFSYIYTNKYLYDNKKNINEIINFDSVITSRPLNVYLNMNNFSLFNLKESKEVKKIISNYVDYLCVNKEKRKKGIAPQQIYTLAYNSIANNREISTFIFKRESSNTAIVPLTTYNTYLFDFKKLEEKSNLIPYKLTRITENNINLITDYLICNNEGKGIIKNEFKVYIIPDITNIKELIKNECIYIYIVHIEEIIYDIYILRNSEVNYNNKRCIDLIGSVCLYKNKKETENIIKKTFLDGFKNIIKELKKEKFEKILIEKISDNNIILNNLTLEYDFKSVSSYYFYNFSMLPIFSKDCFIIN
jgi:hypothetical protein